jgi:glycosyltransferase 2 family protein
MKLWLRVAVSGGLLALLFVILPWENVRTAIGRLPLSLWLAVLGGFLAGHFLGVLKWRMLVNAAGPRLLLIDAVRCYAAGLFANLCLPSIVGGDVLRAALAARATGSPEAAVLGGVIDRTIDIATLGILIAAGGLQARNVLPGWGAEVLNVTLLVAAVALLILVPIAVRRPLRRWPPRFQTRIGRTLVALRSFSRRPGTPLLALAVSVAIQSFFVVLNSLIGRAVGIELPLAVWFLAWSLAKVAGLLPISLGGLAVRDATFAALLVPIGVPAALGVVASLVWQSVLIVGGLLAGLIWWILARYNPSSSPGANRQVLTTATRDGRYA